MYFSVSVIFDYSLQFSGLVNNRLRFGDSHDKLSF